MGKRSPWFMAFGFPTYIFAISVLPIPALAQSIPGCNSLFIGVYSSTVQIGDFTHTETDTVTGNTVNGTHTFTNGTVSGSFTWTGIVTITGPTSATITGQGTINNAGIRPFTLRSGSIVLNGDGSADLYWSGVDPLSGTIGGSGHRTPWLPLYSGVYSSTVQIGDFTHSETDTVTGNTVSGTHAFTNGDVSGSFIWSGILTITGPTSATIAGQGTINNAGTRPFTLSSGSVVLNDDGSADLYWSGVDPVFGPIGGYGMRAATCTGSTKITIIPPPQLSVGAGLSYNGPFAATGGTGTGYTWCVLAGSACDRNPQPASLPTGFNLSSTGLLSAPVPAAGTPIASVGNYPFTIQVTDSGGNTATQALSLTIFCKVYVQPQLLGNTGDFVPNTIIAQFVPPNNLTLAAYAQACGFSGFDWVQTVTVSPTPVNINDYPPGILNPNVYAENNPAIPLSAPYPDPPLGGYTYEFEDPNFAKGEPNFATAFPYYYSPLDLEKGCVVADLSGNCIANIEPDPYILNFYDAPANPLCVYPNACKGYTTQLVGVCTSPSLAPATSCNASGPSEPLYQWTWTSNVNRCTNWPVPLDDCSGNSGELSLVSSISIYQPPVDVGSGGVTITSINGVPSPPVSVDPSASTIAALDSVSVAITVGQFQGESVPAGTVMLTSGAYTSTAVTLDDNGCANITIPAGSLAIGSDMLTVSYTPAVPVSATYSQAWGTAMVTVNPVTPQITFMPIPSSQTYGTPITTGSLDATAQYNGNPVSGTFTYTTGTCGGGGLQLTAGATILQAGSYSITACFTPSEAGFAAASATVQYLVTPASQSISLGSVAAQLVGATISLSATATSGLQVAFQALTPTVCSVSQSTVMMLSVGTCTIEATQRGAVDYNPANPVEVSFPVMGFTLTAKPASETIRRGVLGVFLLEVKSVNGFRGKVSISCTGGPSESVCWDFPQTLLLRANSAALAIAGIRFRPQDTEGTYTLTFTGVSGTDTSIATAHFIVK